MLKDRIISLAQAIGADIKLIGRSSWTTATRPSPGAVGKVGFNSTTGMMEFFNGSGWSNLTTQAIATLGPELMDPNDFTTYRAGVGTTSARTENSFTTTAAASIWWEWCTVGKNYRFYMDFTKTTAVALEARNNSGGTSDAALGTSTSLNGVFSFDFTATSIGLSFRLAGAGKVTANAISLREIL